MTKKEIDFIGWLYDSLEPYEHCHKFMGQIERDGKYISVGMYGAAISIEKMPVKFAECLPSGSLSAIDSFLCSDLTKVTIPKIKEIMDKKKEIAGNAKYSKCLFRVLNAEYNLKYILLALDACKNGEVFLIENNLRSMFMVKNEKMSVFVLPVVRKKKNNFDGFIIDMKIRKEE